MFLKLLFRRLRGALGVAALWGGVWFLGGLFTAALVAIATGGSWEPLLGIAASMGKVGFLTGGAFAAYLTLRYRDRSLADIGMVRVTLVGGVLAVLLSPGMAATAGLFGALGAATSIKAARSAGEAAPDADGTTLPAEGGCGPLRAG